MTISVTLPKVLIVIGMCLAATLVARPTVAGTAEDEATLEMARQRYQEGVRFYDQKQYDKARAAFLQAYALKKHPSVLLNLALSELRSGYEADAANHFATFLREYPDEKGEHKQTAQEGLSTAKQKVMEVKIAVEAGAEVYIEGDHKGRAPLPGTIFLRPGTHTIEARKEGRVATATVSGAAGTSDSIELRFKAGTPTMSAPSEAGDSGTFRFSTDEPQADTGSQRGKPSFFEWYGESAVPWIGTGLAVIGLGGGAVLSVVAKSRFDSANQATSDIEAQAAKDGISSTGLCLAWDEPPGYVFDPAISQRKQEEYRNACNLYEQRIDTAEKLKKAAPIAFIVGGAAAVGTVVAYFLFAGSEDEEIANKGKSSVSARFVPLVAPGYQGFAAVGHF